MTSLLDIRDLNIDGRRSDGGWMPIVKNASVSVAPGEVVAFIGESGAGKTTLALSALGYTRPGTRVRSGSVHFGDVDVLSLGKKAKLDLRGRSVAYVAQSAAAALNPSIQIGDQVAEGLLIHKLADATQARARTAELLNLLRLPDPAKLIDRYPQQTSGGQQQRIMMAIAMSCAPKLLVLDEPTTALDVTTQIEVLKAIRDAIRTLQTAAIYVSHDLAVVAQIASRIVVLRHGEIVETGTTESILRDARHDYTKALLAAVKTIPHEIRAASTARDREKPILQVTGVAASYLKRRFRAAIPTSWRVIDDISFEVRRGETLALVGESGSGKSTLARVLAGLHEPIAGSVMLDGAKLAGKARRRTKEQLRRIQIVFQSPEQALNPSTRVGESIGRSIQFYFGLAAAARRQRVAELLEMVGLPADFAGKFPSELSGGQRQRVAIARAFAAKPDVILCDEFLSALDTVVATRILKLMADLQASHDVAYVFISHDLATVATVADRVAVMYAGKVVQIGPTADVFKPPHHPYTGLLIRSVPELRTDWLDEALADRDALNIAAKADA